MTSDRIDELIALAALGELSAEERDELDEAVRRVPAVAAELDEALATAASLQGPHAEEPPAALRDSVLAAIVSTPQELVVDGAEADALSGAARRLGAPVVSFEAERTRRRFRPVLLAAAAVALFVVGGVALVATNGDSNDSIAAVVDAPDATVRDLAGDIDGMTVISSVSEGALVVQGDGLAPIDDTATYQLWLVDAGGGATSVGTFRPGADGSVSQRFADTDPTGFVVGVTREPAGGSDSPTLPILASA